MTWPATEPGTPPVSLDELKAWLRIEGSGEDAILAGLIRTASSTCEAFIGRLLIARAVEEAMPAPHGWTRLSATPARAIAAVAAIDGDGAAEILPIDAYAIDIDAAGEGWVRLSAPIAAARVRIAYRAGLAEEPADLPEAIRHGILRLTAHLYAHRETAGEQPPSAVTALWRPWRRLRMG